MKIRIELTVEVDADAWNLEYGTTAKNEVRKDVLSHVRDVLAQAPVPMIPVGR